MYERPNARFLFRCLGPNALTWRSTAQRTFASGGIFAQSLLTRPRKQQNVAEKYGQLFVLLLFGQKYNCLLDSQNMQQAGLCWAPKCCSLVKRVISESHGHRMRKKWIWSLESDASWVLTQGSREWLCVCNSSCDCTKCATLVFPLA